MSIQIWLDDVRPAPAGFRHCLTAAQAINLLQTEACKFISLDHDLGDDENGTGYDVAKWIERQAADGALDPIDWAVHSANPVGRKNMEAAMRGAERWWQRRRDLGENV